MGTFEMYSFLPHIVDILLSAMRTIVLTLNTEMKYCTMKDFQQNWYHPVGEGIWHEKKLWREISARDNSCASKRAKY